MKFKGLQEGPRYLILISIALGIILLDQGTKFLIHRSMHLHESITIVEGFFAITYIRNPGAAFGFLANLSDHFRFYFFIIISIVALIFLGAFFFKTPREDFWTQLGISMVVGGAVGNLIDRLRLGEVIDFLDFFVGSTHWPAFNVADSAISIGLALLILQLFLHSRAETVKHYPPRLL
ncbi:MAG: signal peptidase II [Nitrospira sp.]|nr:signal peptidase II [Nitrospira sp.]